MAKGRANPSYPVLVMILGAGVLGAAVGFSLSAASWWPALALGGALALAAGLVLRGASRRGWLADLDGPEEEPPSPDAIQRMRGINPKYLALPADPRPPADAGN